MADDDQVWDLTGDLNDLVALSSRLSASLGPWASTDAMANAAAELSRRYEDLWKQSLAGIEEIVRTNLPENWHGMQSDELAVIDVIKDTGLCLVWTPRAALIDELVAAEDPADCMSTLANARVILLEDLEAALDDTGEVTLAGFDDAMAFAREALAAAKAGHMTAAQALVACGLGPVIHRSFGWEKLGEAYKRFRKSDIEEAGMTVLKVTVLQLCTARSLTNYSGLVPSGFNRHATQHGARSWFSEESALAGLLLLVGWLREFRWLGDHHPGVFRQQSGV